MTAAAETAPTPAPTPARRATADPEAAGPLLRRVAAVELALTAVALLMPATLPAVLLMHAAVAAGVVAWLSWRWRQGRVTAVGLLLGVLLPVLGPVAAVGALATMALAARWRRDALTVDEWYVALFPDEDRSRAEALYEAIVSGRETVGTDSVVSFMDVLDHGALAQKQAMLSLLTTHFRPPFAPVLRRALDDDLAAIRVQAASAVAEIEGRFQDRLMALQDAVEAAPEAADRWTALARHLDDYAYTGLLDPGREADNRERALDAYLKAIDLDPGAPGPRIAVARLLMRQHRPAEARVWITTFRETAGVRAPELDDWYAECLYALREYDTLRDVAALRLTEAAHGTPVRAAVLPALGLWSGRPDWDRLPVADPAAVAAVESAWAGTPAEGAAR